MSAEDVIVWALEQRTFSRTPVKQKAATIMREFAFNGYEVIRTADRDRARRESADLRRALDALKEVIAHVDDSGQVPMAYIVAAQMALANVGAT